MTYTFSDRLKEWTSYAGVVVAALSAAIPMLISPTNHVWVEIWQALQIGLGSALVFIPQTAGTTAIENEAWTLLKAFSGRLPPDYASVTQPLVSELASVLAKSQTPTPPGLPPVAVQPTPPAAVVVAPEPPVAPAKPAPVFPFKPTTPVPLSIPPKILVDPATRPQK